MCIILQCLSTIATLFIVFREYFNAISLNIKFSENL